MPFSTAMLIAGDHFNFELIVLVMQTGQPLDPSDSSAKGSAANAGGAGRTGVSPATAEPSSGGSVFALQGRPQGYTIPAAQWRAQPQKQVPWPPRLPQIHMLTPTWEPSASPDHSFL